jgi:hypothetical protein
VRRVTVARRGIRLYMPSSVARLVGQDHDRLVRLLRRACSAGPNQDRWRTEFVDLLRAHRVAEREALARETGEAPPDVLDAAGAQDATDDQLDLLAEAVGAAPIGGDEFAELCARAQDAVRVHDRSLRERVLEPLAAAVGRKEMRRRGGRYEHERDDYLAGAAGHRAPPRRLDLSRAELYELAKRAGVEGRSGMSRDQLIDELQRRQQHH